MVQIDPFIFLSTIFITTLARNERQIWWIHSIDHIPFIIFVSNKGLFSIRSMNLNIPETLLLFLNLILLKDSLTGEIWIWQITRQQIIIIIKMSINTRSWQQIFHHLIVLTYYAVMKSSIAFKILSINICTTT